MILASAISVTSCASATANVLNPTSDDARAAVTDLTGYAWSSSSLDDGTTWWVTESDALTSDYPCTFEFVGDPAVVQGSAVIEWNGSDADSYPAGSCVGILQGLSAVDWVTWSSEIVADHQADMRADMDWDETTSLDGITVRAEYVGVSDLLTFTIGER